MKTTHAFLIPTYEKFFETPSNFRIIFDPILGWLIEHCQGNCGLAISEKTALYLIKAAKRSIHTTPKLP